MENELKIILREKGLKVTKIRLQVLEILIKSGMAMSHSQISGMLGEDEADKVTLYRTLNTFTEKRLAHKVATEDRNWLYAIYEEDAQEHDDHNHEHAHFVCNECDKIYCLPFEDNNLEFKQKIKAGFRITSREVRLHGLCPVCQ